MLKGDAKRGRSGMQAREKFTLQWMRMTAKYRGWIQRQARKAAKVALVSHGGSAGTKSGIQTCRRRWDDSRNEGEHMSMFLSFADAPWHKCLLLTGFGDLRQQNDHRKGREPIELRDVTGAHVQPKCHVIWPVMTCMIKHAQMWFKALGGFLL